jgi:hypothetical protein
MKFLFRAHHSDSTIIEQTSQDISQTTPGKSAYFDVNHEKLVLFELYEANNPRNSVIVNIIDKSITICSDTLRTILSPPEEPLSNVRLIYFRRNTQVIGGPVDTVFNVGWQANDERGNNVKRIVEVF